MIVGARQDRIARTTLARVVDDVQADVDRFGSLDAARAIGSSTDALAIHDGADQPLAMTPAYAAIHGAVRSRSTARLRSGELDYSSDVCHDETGAYVAHHAAIRYPTADLAGIVTVARRIARGPAPPPPPRVDATT